MMWDKLAEVERRYEELGQMLSSQEIVSDSNLLRKYSKEHNSLNEIVVCYKEHSAKKKELEGSKEVRDSSKDQDLVDMAKEEIEELEKDLARLEEELKFLLIPKDPNDDKNIILEIRAGAGGDEASIFAGDLFRMYTRYGDGRSWKTEIMGSSLGTTGGYKEIIAMISGNGAYSRFKYESGVHRVQRVPATESQGRIHTSTVTVAVLPEAEDVEVNINANEIRVDIYRSSGPGGQSVNTTDSAVRLTHIPTGLVVAIQDEKSQIKNKEKAMKVLKSRLLEKEQSEKDAERRDARRGQVGTGDRSEKVRTYNYPQSRVTDHRIGLTLHSLDALMDGDVDQVVEPLIRHYQAESLKGDE